MHVPSEKESTNELSEVNPGYRKTKALKGKSPLHGEFQGMTKMASSFWLYAGAVMTAVSAMSLMERFTVLQIALNPGQK
jgi:hypothetical protein